MEVVLAEIRAALDEGPAPSTPSTTLESMESLRPVLESDRWPECANRNLVCDPADENAKVQRGRGIVELLVEGSLSDKKFLDFGCGEGHSAAYVASKKSALSVGYDITPKNWDKKAAPNLKLTDKWDEVVASGPYDAILVFDVIDHLAGETPVDVLAKVKSVLADDGRVYLRAHPWTSRHAHHNYHDLNKGWVHLVFTEEELKTLIPNPQNLTPNTGGVKYPLATYKGYFDKAGLEIVEGKTRPVKDNVEAFFKTPAIANRIIANTGMKNFPEFQLSMSFIDYQLKRPENPSAPAR